MVFCVIIKLMDGSRTGESHNQGDYLDRPHGWEHFQPKLSRRIKEKLGSTAKELNDYNRGSNTYCEEEKAHKEYHAEQEKRRLVEEKRGDYPSYYHDWQIECLETIKDKKNVILSSPTGSGKTTVFLDWAERKREESNRENKGHHTIYITAPTKALSNQRFEELQQAGYRVGLETGDIKIIPENENGINDVDYICCTQEIYTNKYAEDENATLVIDEFHYIFENPDRSRSYIDGLHKSKAKNSLICSATFGDVSQTVSYIQSVTGKNQYGYENHDRLTELDIMDGIEAENIHDALVVSFSARNCKEIAKTMYSLRKNGYKTEYIEGAEEYEGRDGDILDRYVEHEKEIEVDANYEYDERRAKEVEELAKTLIIENKSLIDWARYGVSTYYGDMLPKEKKFVEQAFANRLIDIVAGTDALALGVNFPVEMVVFGQLAKYKDGPISKNLFDQLAGRAGRLGYFDNGEVYYCDDFYWEDRNGNHHSIEGRGYNTRDIFERLKDASNESLSVVLTPDYKAILHGDKTIKEEAEFLRKNSIGSKPISESDLTEMCKSITDDALELVFHDIAMQAISSIEDEDDDFYWDYETDYENRTIMRGRTNRRGEFEPYEWHNVEEIESYKEIEAAYLYENFGATSVEEFNDRFKEIISKCYNPELSISGNRQYALLIMSGNSEEFDSLANKTNSLRSLLGLRSYLLSLPQEYRKNFIDNIFKIELRIDELDKNVLNEGRGRISLSEISDLLRQSAEDDSSIDSIGEKLTKSKDKLTSEEIEFLFEVRRSINIVDIYDKEQYSKYIHNLRNKVSLRDVIDSGVNLANILGNGEPDNLRDWLNRQPEWLTEDNEYCFKYLLDNNLISDIIGVSPNFLGKVSVETIYDNLQDLLKQGVPMGKILGLELHFNKPSQIELFSDVSFDELTEYKYHIFDSMEVLKKVNEQYGVSFEELAKLHLISYQTARNNLRQLVELGVSPNSLIYYCFDFTTVSQGWNHREKYTPHNESLQELLELGADSKELIKHADSEWIIKNATTLMERGIIDAKKLEEEQNRLEMLNRVKKERNKNELPPRHM